MFDFTQLERETFNVKLDKEIDGKETEVEINVFAPSIKNIMRLTEAKQTNNPLSIATYLADVLSNNSEKIIITASELIEMDIDILFMFSDAFIKWVSEIKKRKN